MPGFRFHPQARIEYLGGIEYYLRHASPHVADAFADSVESAILHVLESPDRWRIVEPPDIRRYVFRRFPYALYYRWETDLQQITIFAVMHCSREPGY
jgi:plasmid stabilization system protein ParE